MAWRDRIDLIASLIASRKATDCLTPRELSALSDAGQRIDERTFNRFADHAAMCAECRRKVCEAVNRDTVGVLTPFLAFVIEIMLVGLPLQAHISLLACCLGHTVSGMASLAGARGSMEELLEHATGAVQAFARDRKEPGDGR